MAKRLLLLCIFLFMFRCKIVLPRIRDPDILNPKFPTYPKCYSDSDCRSYQQCSSKRCRFKDIIDNQCQFDSDCQQFESCQSGLCIFQIDQCQQQCQSDQFCQKGRCVLFKSADNCGGKVCGKGFHCQAGFCVSSKLADEDEQDCSRSCPFSWQKCYQNQCFDPCTHMSCSNCLQGRCIQDQAD